MNHLFMLRFLAPSPIPMGEGWGEGNHRANNLIVGIGLIVGCDLKRNYFGPISPVKVTVDLTSMVPASTGVGAATIASARVLRATGIEIGR